MSKEGKAVCPPVEELEYSGPVLCPVEGCGKELPSSSCLRMHVVRRHQGQPLERIEKERCVEFFCPVQGCNRSRGGQPFPRLGQLKQHYQSIHGQRNHTCPKCGKQFALRDVFHRHQRECRQKITCTTCGLDFRTRNALYQHAKRKGHTLPEGSKPKPPPQTGKPSQKPQIVLVPVPVSLKTVVPIPKKRNVISTSSQTEECMFAGNFESSVTPAVELQSCGSQTVAPTSEISLCSLDQSDLLCPASEVLSFGTQTHFPSPSSSLFPSTSSQACQTLNTPQCDFGTQTLVNTDHMTHFLMVGDPASADPLSLAPTDFGLVEFGTQTTDSQTYFSDTAEFGTQTNELSSLELDNSFCSHLLPPDCLDFGTQTLESTFSHSVQTLLQNDTRDQSSQT